MYKRIPESTIDEIKSRTDIVDLLSEYVNFTKKSGSNLFALCPFHSEKTPSFSVSLDKDIFYCFGCHKGGDAITFIMEMEHLSYPEAIKFLGERLGIEVNLTSVDNDKYKEEKRKKERLYALNTEAARFFYKQLNSNVGKACRKYLRDRKISKSTAINFGLGYASPGWQDLYDHIKAKGFTEAEVQASGLFKKNKYGKFYDLFRDRLIFPIIDVFGNIVAFGGRVLDDSLPKYVNSPETKVYTKGEHLYGLNLAKKSKEDYLIVVEGYMDCLSLHQAGFKQAVASLGTALTKEQATILRKYREQIVLGYDMDSAGRNATLKNIKVLEEKNIKVNVLVLDAAKDPDEYLKTHSAREFQKHLEAAPKALDYRFLVAKDLATKDGNLDRIEYQNLATTIIAQINNPVVRELYTEKTADEIDVSFENLNKVVQSKLKQRSEKTRKSYKRRSNKKRYRKDKTQDESNKNTGAIYLRNLEINTILDILFYQDIYKELDLDLSLKYIKCERVKPFVKAFKEALKRDHLDKDSFFTLINSLEDLELRNYLSKLFAKEIMNYKYENNSNLLKERLNRELYSLHLDYLNRYSKKLSALLDRNNSEENEAKLRKEFLEIRQEKFRLQRFLNEQNRL